MGSVRDLITDHAFEPISESGRQCGFKLADQEPCLLAKHQHSEVPVTGQSEAVDAFTAHADATLRLVREKDKAYGGAWQQQGYMGNLARIMSKTARLQSMMWRDDPDRYHLDEMGESITDTLHDLMALAAFMATNIEEENRWGT